jgi:serine protease Do
MRTLRRYHWRSIFVLCMVVLALTLPLVAVAAVPTPVVQRNTGASAPAPIDNLEDVQRAVVRIEAVGAFRDPDEEMLVGAGSGSGFIIDPEGYVVTNNHVVTGAALFKVYLDGKAQPVNARVMGVSECADLAVIDLQGNGYPYLAWYDQPLKVGLDVYAAGFPLGDPEYTLTRGIIAKARADGETNWASVDGVIQHDAIIDHGNSGGPLVTADGLIAGINYAGNRDANQFYAIGSDGALAVIEQLLEGNDVDSIGVNSSAVMNDDGSIFGIWVASVASGSPADGVGLKPGDIITAIENVPVGADGTMSTYCEILRSHAADDVMAIEVLRFDTEEVLEGQLNGRKLQQSVSLAAEEPGAQQSGEEPAAGENYDEFVSVADAQGILTFDAPAPWMDIQDGEWEFNDEVVGIRLDISPDLANFYNDWGIPGAILRFSDVLPDQMAVEESTGRIHAQRNVYKGRTQHHRVGRAGGRVPTVGRMWRYRNVRRHRRPGADRDAGVLCADRDVHCRGARP